MAIPIRRREVRCSPAPTWRANATNEAGRPGDDDEAGRHRQHATEDDDGDRTDDRDRHGDGDAARDRGRLIRPGGVGCGGRPGFLGRAIAIGRRVGEAPLPGRRRRRVGRRRRRRRGLGRRGVGLGRRLGRGRVGHRVIVARVAVRTTLAVRARATPGRGGRRMATLDSSHRESPEPRPPATRPLRRPARRGARAIRANAERLACARAARGDGSRRDDRDAQRRGRPPAAPARRRSSSPSGSPLPGDRRPGPDPRIRRVDRAALPPPVHPDGRRHRPVRGAPRGAAERPRPGRAPARRPRRSTRRSAATAGTAGSPATPARRTPSSSCSTRAADR